MTAYWYGETTFKGTTVNHILSDKICVLSGGKIFRRIKDMIDVYALSQCVTVQVQDILNMAFETGRKVGSFDTFLSRHENLNQGYGRLKMVNEKPPFEEVYSYLTKFIQPFLSGSRQANMEWSSISPGLKLI